MVGASAAVRVLEMGFYESCLILVMIFFFLIKDQRNRLKFGENDPTVFVSVTLLNGI